MGNGSDHLNRPVLSVAHKDFTTLLSDSTVEQALDSIRQGGVQEKIVYFYVVDADSKLIGVLPTRRLLTSRLDLKLSDVMIKRVIAIPKSFTVLEACEVFVMHKFLAFPVVDEERRILGVVDISLVTEEAFDIAEREQTDALFEALGFRINQVRRVSPVQAFRFRFPWLLATIASGTLCAVLASAYQVTLEKSIVLAFFLTMVLGLGESVSIQSMTIAINALKIKRPTLAWYLASLRREAGTAFLIAAASGLLVALIALVWRGAGPVAAAIGGGIFLSLCSGCFFGLTIPSILHALKLDPKIAAGPITLALADIFTLLFYFSLAALLI